MAQEYSLVLAGGRVIDPQNGLDAVGDVGIAGDTVAAVSATPLRGARTIDATGLVVCPGFVDLHSHGQAIPEQRLQALDGVTTALELEAGTTPVAAAYARSAAEGRPLNYGFSTSWALARMVELAGADAGGAVRTVLRHLGNPAWQAPASPVQQSAVLERLYADLDAGALGIGILAGYAPLVDPAEYLAVAALAAQAGTPTFTHARALVETNPDIPIDGAEEIVRAAGQTGAHMHYCHINSTSTRHIDRVHALIQRCLDEGSPISTEAYPYGAGATAVGAAFLAPDKLHAQGLRPDSIVVAATAERIADARRLAELRATTPDAIALVHFLDDTDPGDQKLLNRALLFPDTVIASDAMPLTWRNGEPDPMLWPLPHGAEAHPRGAGTFTRSLRTLALNGGHLSLSEAIARCTVTPARVLRPAVPAMERKGHIGAGSDADIVVFDPSRLQDRATYADGTRPAQGVVHLLVNGEPVVHDGAIVPDALPGRPVRRGA
ncbi:amidohydrolase family protein [Nocardiopsis ansamitocini]|uniref:D-glutamate deacylase n=1 Tax=Nocardiopsis ansamitocini TaxID=1670832 RepID=A0A9W6ULP1_9ACTN|nr:amidohydrolase family protein [Nocardiopsis ansamitocini]GLU50270.1 D-glutamate deacylase [Nocardiopsis ansamitocini]